MGDNITCNPWRTASSGWWPFWLATMQHGRRQGVSRKQWTVVVSPPSLISTKWQPSEHARQAGQIAPSDCINRSTINRTEPVGGLARVQALQVTISLQRPCLYFSLAGRPFQDPSLRGPVPVPECTPPMKARQHPYHSVPLQMLFPVLPYKKSSPLKQLVALQVSMEADKLIFWRADVPFRS